MKDIFDLTRGILPHGYLKPLDATVVTPAKPAKLAWVIPPPATASVGVDITATWAGGKPPYTVDITGAVLLNNQQGNQTSIIGNVDGTNQTPGDYVWTVRDAAGTEITGTTNYRIEPFVITKQPKDVAVPVGATGKVSVEVAGGVPPYTYQWYYTEVKAGNEQPGGFINIAGTFSGQNTAELTITGVAATVGDYLRVCQITDAAGSVLITNKATISATTAATT